MAEKERPRTQPTKKVRSKRVPLRSVKHAEEYAKKVRMEPPKATRQDPGASIMPARADRTIPGQHDHGPPQQPKNKKYPEGGKPRR